METSTSPHYHDKMEWNGNSVYEHTFKNVFQCHGLIPPLSSSQCFHESPVHCPWLYLDSCTTLTPHRICTCLLTYCGKYSLMSYVKWTNVFSMNTSNVTNVFGLKTPTSQTLPSHWFVSIFFFFFFSWWRNLKNELNIHTSRHMQIHI